MSKSNPLGGAHGLAAELTEHARGNAISRGTDGICNQPLKLHLQRCAKNVSKSLPLNFSTSKMSGALLALGRENVEPNSFA